VSYDAHFGRLKCALNCRLRVCSAPDTYQVVFRLAVYIRFPGSQRNRIRE